MSTGGKLATACARLSAIGLLLSGLSMTTLAESPPGSIPVGPMFAYPQIEIATKRDSNIVLRPDSAADKKADTIWYLRPSLRLEAKHGANVYDVTYRGNYGRYNSSKPDNFNDHDLSAHANMTGGVRNNLQLGLRYQDKVDPRGTLNVKATPTPNEWHQPSANVLYTYGATGAEGKLEFSGSYLNKWYVNNLATTSGLDHSEGKYGGTFLWRVMPKTYATFNLHQDDYTYKRQTLVHDSTNTFELIGLRWEATAATTGKFAIGHVKKKFDASGHNAGWQDFSGTSWTGSITWQPLKYSTFDLTTERTPNDSTGAGDYMLHEANNLRWTYDWSSRVSSTLSAGYSTDKFRNDPVAAAGNADRLDKTSSAGLHINYQMRRWLKLGVNYDHTTRNSNDNGFDYNVNDLMLLLSAKL